MKIFRMNTEELKTIYNAYKILENDDNGKDDNAIILNLKTVLLKRMLDNNETMYDEIIKDKERQGKTRNNMTNTTLLELLNQTENTFDEWLALLSVVERNEVIDFLDAVADNQFTQ